jgi:CRP-like cAMP-binding protein
MFDTLSARIPLLAALAPADRERLRSQAVVRHVPDGEALWRESEPAAEFLFLLRGRAKLARTSESGREVILDTCGEGELLCGSAACAGLRYCCTAAALHAPAAVLALPRRAVLDAMEHNPGVALALLEEASRRESHLARRIEELSSGHVERRVAALLLRLAEQLGVPRADDGTWIPVSLSRQDLADLCGTTVETAIRTMTRLRRDGVVRSAGGGFIVADLRRLAGIARSRA